MKTAATYLVPHIKEQPQWQIRMSEIGQQRFLEHRKSPPIADMPRIGLQYPHCFSLCSSVMTIRIPRALRTRCYHCVISSKLIRRLRRR